MGELRWVLLLFGCLALGLVFLYSRGWFSARRAALKQQLGRISLPRSTLKASSSPSDPEAEEPAPPEPPLRDGSKVVAVRLMPAEADAFQAEALILALREAGLRHGKFGIFHRYMDDEDRRTIFAVANLIEPGAFDLSRIKEGEYEGVSFFMVLPGPEDGVKAFDEMLEAARQIARSTDGMLCDEVGSKLSIQRERYLREEVIAFERQRSIQSAR